MKKILVVEDEKNIRTNLMDILEMSGYSVSTAENGRDAILMMQESIPDLVISDIRMPVMDGKELLINIRKRIPFKTIPFLFLTSKTELEDIREGMNNGADDYITKPFKYEELLKAIQIRLSKYDDLMEEGLAKRTEEENKKNSKRVAELRAYLKKLSASEVRILEELAKNLSSEQISENLYLSTKTVQNHRHNMSKKLNFKGQNSLLEFAINCLHYGVFK